MARILIADAKLVKERFEAKYVKVESGCWEWTGAMDGGGYGIFKSNKKTNNAHRWSYKIYIGEIPIGLNVCHECDNRKCVNPSHLKAATQRVNIQDAQDRNRIARKKHPSRSSYIKDKCRCDECKKLASDYSKIRNQLETVKAKRRKKK